MSVSACVYVCALASMCACVHSRVRTWCLTVSTCTRVCVHVHVCTCVLVSCDAWVDKGHHHTVSNSHVSILPQRQCGHCQSWWNSLVGLVTVAG